MAFERSFAGVDASMSFQMGRAGERSRANVAPEGFLASVRPDVRPQFGSPFTVLETKRTDGLNDDATGAALIGIGQHGKRILIGLACFVFFVFDIFFVLSLFGPRLALDQYWNR